MSLQRWVTYVVTAFSAPLYTPMLAILLLGFMLEARGLLIAWTLKDDE